MASYLRVCNSRAWMLALVSAESALHPVEVPFVMHQRHIRNDLSCLPRKVWHVA